MCLILLAVEQHPDYPLIIAANRDERYQRPTKPMHWWNNVPILAGKDLDAGGTWLGISKTGRFAAVTNYREVNPKQSRLSRGHLPHAWLSTELTAEQFIAQINPADYAGFNLLIGDIKTAKLCHFSNRDTEISALSQGLHGLSNALLNSPWPKIQQAIPKMQQLCQQDVVVEDWLQLLANRQAARDELLPNTGVGIEAERLLSPRFIQGTDYGTRCSTIITAHRSGKVNVLERSFDAKGAAIAQQVFQWQLTA